MGCCLSDDSPPLLDERNQLRESLTEGQQELPPESASSAEQPTLYTKKNGKVGHRTFRLDKSLRPHEKLDRTIRPHKTHRQGTRKWELHQRITATLGSGVTDMRQVVQLPDSEDIRIDEWVALHVVDFYNDISLLYGAISELCTISTCPMMSAGPKYTYLWADGVTIKTPIKLPACDYINYLMEWVDVQLSNETIFPFDENPSYPPNFTTIAQTILKRLFRVYAHIYHSHFTQFVQLGAEAHLNTCFKRFAYFVKEFELVEEKELAPLAQLIQSMMSTAKQTKNGKVLTPEEQQIQFDKLGGGPVN